jgi:DeoR/GlpR family transcriptional regulator of sugar metabolism
VTASSSDASRRHASPDLRREVVRRLVAELGYVRVNQLADECGVSIMTVHRDLDELEARGYLCKVRGGATSAPIRTFHGDLAHRMRAQLREKKLMAEFVMRTEVEPGQVVAFDDSTTALAVARLLPRRAPLTVVAHFLPIIRALADYPNIEIIGLGGRYVPSYDSFLGQAAAEAATQLHTDVLFMSTTAVIDGVCYIQSQDTVVTRRALFARAERTVALVDHTKFGRRALHRLVDLAELDRVVVDPDTPQQVVRDLMRRSVAVEVADGPP